MERHSALIDLTNKRFGRLTVLYRGQSNKWNAPRWMCLCDCGQKKLIEGSSLKNGSTKSCGCLHNEGNNTKHGHSIRGKETTTYKSWKNMNQRCNNPNHIYYHHYGGRRITVCKRWMKFENFLEDMGECPPRHTIEREKNREGYCRKNCRWATRTEQQRNKRNNLYITHKDKTQLLIEWAEETGIPYKILWDRIYKLKWSTEKALTTP